MRACAYDGESLVMLDETVYSVDNVLASGADNVKLTLVERIGNR